MLLVRPQGKFEIDPALGCERLNSMSRLCTVGKGVKLDHYVFYENLHFKIKTIIQFLHLRTLQVQERKRKLCSLFRELNCVPGLQEDAATP